VFADFKSSESTFTDPSPAFEILNFAFMLLGGFLRVERAEVATLTCLRIFLARIKSILSGFQFSDHAELPADAGSNHSTRMRIPSHDGRTLCASGYSSQAKS